MHFDRPRFTDVEERAYIFLTSAPAAWAGVADCGESPCTGPDNILLTFESATFSGTTPSEQDPDFTVISNNAGVAVAFGNKCELKNFWNAYYCRFIDVGILLFESLDSDAFKRTVSPIILTNDDSGFNNVLNSFMDHYWDGFYTSQKRMSRFPSLLPLEEPVLITYTGTPPDNQRFTIRSQEPGYTIVTIDYDQTNSYAISDDDTGTLIEPNPWDNSIAAQAEISGRVCGENRFTGVENILQFVLTNGCTLRITPRDVVQSRLRLEWTMAEFWADGG